MKTRTILVAATMLSLAVAVRPAAAKVRTLAEYKVGAAQANSGAIGPPTLLDGTGAHHDLARLGQPKFVAEAPANRTGGALAFDGEHDAYQQLHEIGKADDNFVLEAWVQAKAASQPGFHAVVANGDGGQGYSLAQHDGQWVAFVGSVGAFPIGSVEPGQWVHLAMVADGAKCRTYLNGRDVGVFQRGSGLSPCFKIAALTNPDELFQGAIHHVRLSTFAAGEFEPDHDFLIDYETIRAQERVRVAAQAKRIAAVAAERVVADAVGGGSDVGDWLITRVARPVELQIQPATDGQTATLVLSNGLISRTFFLSENLACVGFKNLANAAEFLRSTEPEARVRIDGAWSDIGGMDGPAERAYLLENWLSQLHAAPAAFRFVGLDTQAPEARYPWQQKFHAVAADWPPRGLRVNLHFAAPAALAHKYRDLKITVHYEMYVGLPVVAKWLTVENGTGEAITIDEFESERLAVNQDQLPRLHSESDYSFALANAVPSGSVMLHLTHPWQLGGSTTQWRDDPRYDTWATHYPLEDTWLNYPHHCLLVSRPPLGPDWRVAAGEHFNTYVNFELLHDSDDRERQSLGHRQFYRRLAPQVTENVLTVASAADTPEDLRKLIDQAQEFGFEALELPTVDHSNLTPEYVAKWKAISDYAAQRGLVSGGYELQVASRGRGKQFDCIDPDTKLPGSPFGQSVCIASGWKDAYYPRMFEFFRQTGFKTTLFDGPYHGDVCAASDHPHHRGLNDSQWAQWRTQVEVLHEFQRLGCYIPIPDWYFLNGQCATGMGYREASANLSPSQQMLLGRQYIYDGTWHKAPTMGWMSLQLVGYYTRDAKVGLEPLADNLDRYERCLLQYLGSGCRLSVRGSRLYDTPATKALVRKWTDWFHKHREILASDIIHLGRPTGRDLDCMFHVNPALDTRGLAVVFNPTPRRITRKLTMPLYYTGLTGHAQVRDQQGTTAQFALDSKQQIEVPVDIEADGYCWFVVEPGVPTTAANGK